MFFSIFFLKWRIFNRHACLFCVAFGQLQRESGQFECWDGDGRRHGELVDMIEMLECCV